MPDKKPEWSDYAYDNDSISKRLGIGKDEVRKLKDDAAARSKQTGEAVIDSPNIGVGIGGSIDINDLRNSNLRVGAKIPGFGVEYDTNGEGSIDIVNLIKVETVRIKCFYIQRFYLAGQFLYSDIQKIDSEECNKEPDPPPDPPPNPKPPDPPPDPKPKAEGSESKQVNILMSRTYSFSETQYYYDEVTANFTNSYPTIISIKDIVNDIIFCNISYGFTFWEPNLGYVHPYSKILSFSIFEYFSSLIRLETPYGIVTYRGIDTYPAATLPQPIFILSGSEIAVNWMSMRFEGSNTFAGWLTSNTRYIAKEQYNINNKIDLDNQVINKSKSSPIQITQKKKMEKECCDKLEKLLKKLAKYQGLGQKIKPINVKDNKIEEIGSADENFPMKIPKRWIDREAKPKDDVEITSMRHLLLSIGVMLDRFEELFNPAGKDKGFPLKKPEEGLWKWLPGDGGDYEAPDPDFDPKKSKDDGKIGNKKLKIETYLDLFRYFLESQIRLELLFPIAQIRDSKISKRLIYPKAPGEIVINDLIQFQELMLLFINKTLGDPSGAVIIKDADPTQAGEQPLTIENFDISDMLRKLLRFSVDINSDIDLGNNFGKRTLYQLLSAMQVLVKNHEMTEAIFEDLGMKEEQSFVPVKFFADPYAGAWEAGKGFDPSKVKIENSEAAIEANLEAFLQEKEVEVKVSRRAKDETTDIRDLLAQIGRYAAELAAMGKIPNNPEAIQQAIDKARFELQTESAIRRTDVRQASAAGRIRTKRNKPKNNPKGRKR